jgi:hypothetical protein
MDIDYNSAMPRFVLLYHDCPTHGALASHWDFMLESGDMLRTWRLMQLPRLWKAAHDQTVAQFRSCPALAESDAIAAAQLGDHRLAYLDYEGDVSGGRGRVIRVATGTYAYASEAILQIKCKLEGDSVDGHVVLERKTPQEESWMLLCDSATSG